MSNIFGIAPADFEMGCLLLAFACAMFAFWKPTARVFFSLWAALWLGTQIIMASATHDLHAFIGVNIAFTLIHLCAMPFSMNGYVPWRE